SITLLPKERSCNCYSYCLNTQLKLLSKALAQRSTPSLPTIISPDQKGFIS
ncbi:Hypothetical predicted protein, partial [Pelobates cultripes]